MKERLEAIIRDSMMSEKEQNDVLNLFERLWYQYYIGGMDTHFVSFNLRRLWFLYKIMMLIGMTADRDLKAIDLLTKELNANANAYCNENHAIKEFV